MVGDVHLDEVERAIGHTLPRGDIETVAGMIIAQRGALPDEGETVAVELPPEAADLIAQAPLRRQLLVEVLRIERHVPAKVRSEERRVRKVRGARGAASQTEES